MRSMLKKINWSNLLGYGWHLGLLAGSIALRAYAPESAVIWAPLLQAAGQVSPTPPGVTVLR